MTRPTVSVVIATYQRAAFVDECLAHLERQTVRPERVIVVDASPDTDTRDVVARHPGVEYRRNERGIGTTATSRAIGVDDLQEDVVAFLDDDAFAQPTWLEELLKPYDDPGVAAVGGRALNDQPGEDREGLGQIGLLLPDGRLTGFFAADPGRVLDVDHMLGANMSVRMSVVRALGGIRDLYPGTCLREETDIALRIRRAGLRIAYTPFAVVRHVAGVYAKGRRFDTRYRYYGARNHVVLLATTLGYRDPHFRSWLRTAARQVGRNVIDGVRSVRDPERPDLRSKARGVAGGGWRAVVDTVGTTAGVVASARDVARLRRSTRSRVR